MSIGSNIKNLRKSKGLNQLELAEKLDVTDKAVSTWENNYKIPRMGTIEKMCALFGVKKSEILDDEDINSFNKDNVCKIPVLGTVRAGYPTEAVENIIDYEEISEDMAHQGDFFALQVKGDSMEPRFSDGDVVIVRKQEDVDNGDIAIMLVNGDEATIKKVQKFNGGINLIPSNPAYNVITYSNKEIETLPVICLGKVVELRAKF